MMSVPLDIYIRLSLVMFLEYAVWGAWMPVLAARLLGPLKMTGKQTGWIYTTCRWLASFRRCWRGIGGPLPEPRVDPGGSPSDRGGLDVRGRAAEVVRQSVPGHARLVAVLCGDDAVGECVLFRYVEHGGGQRQGFHLGAIAWPLVGYSLGGLEVLRKS